MIIRLTLISLFLVFVSCDKLVYEPSHTGIKGKVVAIKDGDTIDILADNNTITVRLAHIDCPEVRKGQPFSMQAKKFTAEKCFGQLVTVVNDGEYDRYKRLIGVIINECDENVNMELVKAGLAWHYTTYSSDSSYNNAEKTARIGKAGIWSEENPTPPWIWRKPKKITN